MDYFAVYFILRSLTMPLRNIYSGVRSMRGQNKQPCLSHFKCSLLFPSERKSFIDRKNSSL